MSQTPAPAPYQVFSLPLADKTTGTAVLLPTREGQAYLVCASSTGKIFSYLLTPTTTPPKPDPTPQPDPTPPPPTPPPAIAAVITVTPTTPADLPAGVATLLDSAQVAYHAFTVAMVAERDPPENSLTWIGRTAGKQYPYTFFATAEGAILWQGPTPADAPAWKTLLNTFTTTGAASRTCANGTCPTTRKKRP